MQRFTIKNYLIYLLPRRLKLKTILLCIVLFIIFIILIDEKLNNVQESIDRNEIVEDNPMKEFLKFKFKETLKKEIITTTVSQQKELLIVELTTQSINKKNTLKLNTTFEFQLPKLNTNRLLFDDKYRKYVQSLFFNNDNSTFELLVQNLNDTLKENEIKVKECDCDKLYCNCCVNTTVNDLDFQHYSCVNISYDKGEDNFTLSITCNNSTTSLINSTKILNDTHLSLDNTPDLCLYNSNSQYCVLFSESHFYKNTFAGCLKIRFKLLNSRIVLLNKHAGCFKLPSDSKLTWKEILFSNKTIENIQNMNKNIGWII